MLCVITPTSVRLSSQNMLLHFRIALHLLQKCKFLGNWILWPALQILLLKHRTMSTATMSYVRINAPQIAVVRLTVTSHCSSCERPSQWGVCLSVCMSVICDIMLLLPFRFMFLRSILLITTVNPRSIIDSFRIPEKIYTYCTLRLPAV